MSTIQVTLTDPLKAFVETEAAARGYANPGEYVKDVLGEARKRKFKAELEKLALEGLASGPGRPITEEFWQGLLKKIDEGFPEECANEPRDNPAA